MKEIRKLVRDKIPELMAAEGKTVTLRRITKQPDIIPALMVKLDEEINELKEAYNDFMISVNTENYSNQEAQRVIEEMADVLEVLHGLCYHTPITKMMDSVNNKRKAKADERGGFEKMLFVETTE